VNGGTRIFSRGRDDDAHFRSSISMPFQDVSSFRMEIRASCYEEWPRKLRFLILRNAQGKFIFLVEVTQNSGCTLLQCSFAPLFAQREKRMQIESLFSLIITFAREFIHFIRFIYLNFSKHIFCFLFILKQICRGRSLNRKDKFRFLFSVYFLYHTTLYCHALCTH